MPVNIGTRQTRQHSHNHPAECAPNTITTRDVGMTKRVVASIAAGSSEFTAANGTFAAFAVGDPIVVAGSVTVDGFYKVTGIDGTNQAFLTVDPPPKTLASTTLTIRTV